NQDGQLYTTVFQKPSYEPYYLPFNSIHPLHMKKNIPFAMLLRAIRYCSTFESYLNEREKLRLALLLNKYPNKIIDEQFNNVLVKFGINEPLTSINFNRSRQQIIDSPVKEKLSVNYDKSIFVHFTYCSRDSIQHIELLEVCLLELNFTIGIEFDLTIGFGLAVEFNVTIEFDLTIKFGLTVEFDLTIEINLTIEFN
ncbi:unnamed protein product, partial [Rotaria magnacalcarata]